MRVDPLLRSLGSGVLPAGVPGSAPVAGAQFEQLLARAQRGELRTGEGVQVEPGLGISLSDEQSARLAEAADRAAAAGARTAIVQLDGMLLKLDVASRRVTGEFRPQSGEVLTGVDAFVDASAAGDEAVRMQLASEELLRGLV